MAKFGKTSLKRLNTAHSVLKLLLNRVIKFRDCSITCGHRPESEQNACFRKGVSKVKWPNSKHNSLPSLAVDVVPWPEKWGSEGAFLELKDVIEEEWAQIVAAGLDEGFMLRWGGDWDGDGDRTDQTFHDLPHWELHKRNAPATPRSNIMEEINLKNVVVRDGFVNPGKPFPENGTVLAQLQWIDDACAFGSEDRNHALRKALQVAIQEIHKLREGI